MKKVFASRPGVISEEFCKIAGGFSWYDFVAGIPSLVFVVTGWKSNGRENACLHAWSAFSGSGSESFFCVLSKVNKHGHMYQSLRETGVCVLNFPSQDVYDRCIRTIGHNEFEADEITAAGLTAEQAVRVNAPQIRECFLNIECEYLWSHEMAEGSDDLVIALKAVCISFDDAHLDQNRLGRYGQTGYLYQIDQPIHPESGEVFHANSGTITPGAPIEWKTR